MVKTVRLHVPDLPEDMHRDMKVAAAKAGMPIKEWVKEAIREKLDRENGS